MPKNEIRMCLVFMMLVLKCWGPSLRRRLARGIGGHWVCAVQPRPWLNRRESVAVPCFLPDDSPFQRFDIKFHRLALGVPGLGLVAVPFTLDLTNIGITRCFNAIIDLPQVEPLIFLTCSCRQGNGGLSQRGNGSTGHLGRLRESQACHGDCATKCEGDCGLFDAVGHDALLLG